MGWLRGGLWLEGLLQTGPCLLQRVQGQRQRGLPQRHLVQQGLHHVMWRRWTIHLHQVNLHHIFVDRFSDTRSQGCTDLQSLVKCLDHMYDC